MFTRNNYKRTYFIVNDLCIPCTIEHQYDSNEQTNANITLVQSYMEKLADGYYDKSYQNMFLWKTDKVYIKIRNTNCFIAR